VIVFARSLSDPLGRLVQHLDNVQAEHKGADLRVWVTFLASDQPALDPEVVRWGQKHALRTVPLGIFEDVKGPPSYRLAADADVTVLLVVKRRVVAKFAFRSGELTDAEADRVLKAVPGLLAGK
jgi:hypothetical protein